MRGGGKRWGCQCGKEGGGEGLVHEETFGVGRERRDIVDRQPENELSGCLYNYALNALNTSKYCGNVLPTHLGSLMIIGTPISDTSEKHIAMRWSS